MSVIHKYYQGLIESNILGHSESRSLLNLLYDRFTGQEGKQKENIQYISTRLLYRASEHSFTTKSFHKHCDRKGATITVIHNESDYIFGGYTNKSWSCSKKQKKDPNAFLFSIQPTLKSFGLKQGHENRDGAIWCYPEWGPLFGNGNDIWICNRCDAIKGSGCSSISYEIKPVSFCGFEGWNNFIVKDYEVFSINLF